MKLTFTSPYLSIKQFPTTEIPDFTVITGVNGAGKTHLLQAIAAGNISIDRAPDPKNDVRFFDWTTMVPRDVGMFDGHTLLVERGNLSNAVLEFAKAQEGRVVAAARQNGIPAEYVADPAELAMLDRERLCAILGNPAAANAAHVAIAEAVRVASLKIKGRVNDENQRAELETIAAHARRPIFALRRRDFSDNVPSWGTADLFQQSFGRLFVAYRDLWLANQIRKLQRQEGDEDANPLSDAQFIERHMIAPWIFVNDALKAAGLDFEIDRPDQFTLAPYTPRLRKLSTQAEVRFSELSSGEKVLMSFALCLYYAQDTRQLGNYPKLLLLDEIDAPLHPSMSRNLLRIITQTLVEKHDIGVIAATHAASTVALSPEDSIHVMLPNQPGLHKIAKAEALNILTVGVPTLAISYEGRRQVFVESENDAELYSAAYQCRKPILASERSLEFIGTGIKSIQGQHLHTGSAIVRKLVQELGSGGNSSVFGLMDWDGENQPTSRMAILACGRRNGLENLLLDPLFIAAALFREAKRALPRIGINNATSYSEFLLLPVDKLQAIVDCVQTVTLSEKSALPIESEYVGGFSSNFMING